MPAAEIFDKYARRVEDEMPGEHLKKQKQQKNVLHAKLKTKRVLNIVFQKVVIMSSNKMIRNLNIALQMIVMH